MNLDEFEMMLGRVEFVDLFGPVNRQAIVESAKTLGVKLPNQYVSFLEQFGGGGIGSESIIGFGGSDHLNFEFMTKHLRSKHPDSFPDTFVPIRNDGYGNYDCLDTGTMSPTGECSVVEWLHRGGRGNILADDFSGWLDEIMTFVLEEE